MLYPTTSQTVGPYLHIGLSGLNCSDLTAGLPDLGATPVTIHGRVTDGQGKPVPDGMIEIWQADARGVYRHPDDPRHAGSEGAAAGFTGFGRVPTEPDGSFRITTIKPGRVPAPDGALQAPHLVVSLFMRGLLKHLSTRMYFPDEAQANDEDWVLRQTPAARRATLIATASDDGLLRWNVVLQGAGETVFFDI
ncbi:protocatechuate 3,4-dioxygenase subunit alpha [Achromobacter piechaudii]|uniref:Protocatechuate 3,4-dioxygenase alpha chain n=1 Tax=Achromobacter piechaudii TaxID=72556 RepID=A0ABN7F9W7_9BURK|nr:protocatechuate 3,4-dioxygenase subunit alpha [Achromobacter piechaudii]CAB3737682.1 Protocatechuate 3,4-dioxygenase alpha chain [Achromobacter piechaudii]CAB3921773.1 Protocatechuate 3,4-dioxygenase alpha chain [Achromobacter piechaudii]CAB3958325.1 Protocatechuate 3,4-dioxygenase alpha chain [Achromobacter piechaudii]